MPTKRGKRVRNPWATHPLLLKGGVHEQSQSGQRSRLRQDLLDEAEDYLRERASDEDDSDSCHKKREPLAPFSLFYAVTISSS